VIEVMRSAFEKDIERFYKAFRLIVELINKMQDKEKADEVLEMCIKYLLNVRDDIEIEELERTAKEESVERGELIMSIAEKLREEGIKKGKIEGKKEIAINVLSQRFGNELTEELTEKIRNADDETINYIGDNLLEITIEELKEILNLK
jgi:predicted transposase YdaD